MKFLPMKLTTLAAEVAAFALLAGFMFLALLEVIFRGKSVIYDMEDER